jgi:hypothetical protein
MTVLEIAVFAALLGGGSPIVCHLDEAAVTRCSNGYFARALSPTEIRFSNGVTVSRADDALPVFSTGLKSRIDLSGWLRFGNGLAIRRVNHGNYVFSNGLLCISELPTLVNCVVAPPS